MRNLRLLLCVLLAFHAPSLCCAERKRPEAKLVVQTAHAGDVHAVAFSPDGKLAATAGDDNLVKIWHTASGKELHTLVGHEQPVSTVVFSHDGKTLASGGQDTDVNLWNVETGRKRYTIKLNGGRIYALAFGPEDTHLYAACDGHLHIWKFDKLKIVASALSPVAGSGCVAIRPNGQLAVGGGKDTAVKILNAEDGKIVRILAGHAQRVTAVAYAPAGKLLASGAEDNTIRLWKPLATEAHLTLRGHTAAVRALAFSADGKILVSGSLDRSVRFWDASTGKELSAIKDAGHAVESLAVHWNGSIMATAGKGMPPRLWSVDPAKYTAKRLFELTGRLEKVFSVAVSPDGRSVAAGMGYAISLLHPDRPNPVQTLRGPTDRIGALAFSADSKTLASGGGNKDRAIHLWGTRLGRPLGAFYAHSAEVVALEFSPDGKFLVSGGLDRKVHLWEVATRKIVRDFASNNSQVYAVAFSPDGKLVAGACWDTAGAGSATVRLWDAKTGGEVRAFKSQTRRIFALAFSANGKLLASTGESAMVSVWDVGNGKLVHSLLGHPPELARPKPLYALAFVPQSDSTVLAAGGGEGVIYVWDAATGQKLGTPRAHRHPVRALAFADKGRFLYSASGDGHLRDLGDGSIKLWKVKDGVIDERQLCTIASYPDGTWAVVEPSGRYDASNGGDVDWLHWNVHNEPIALTQLKEHYYEPRLLAKLLGLNAESLRKVEPLNDLKLPPRAEITAFDAKKKSLTVKFPKGAVGRVQVFVNKKELQQDTLGNLDPKKGELTIDLTGVKTLKGKKDEVRIVTWNADGTLSSRGLVRVLDDDPAIVAAAKPELYAIVVGVAHYKSDRLNLRYAAKDAEDVAQAMHLGANRLFGADKVHLTLLTSSPGTPGDRLPTKANVEREFAAARRARPNDILFVYLAGHGVAVPETEVYCYLTADAEKLEAAAYTNAKDRQTTTVSSDELVDWIKRVPALKQVMVLDTCASGQAALRLTERRDVPSGQIRAVERLKDRTGFHVLMGCAADRVSFEASQYAQGLLTYALLEGIKGPALDKEKLDVSLLFRYAARRVPEFTLDIGGIQQPLISAPQGQPFDVGQFTEADLKRLTIATPRPVLQLPLLSNPDAGGDDDLKLRALLRKALALRCTSGGRGQPAPAVFVEAEDVAGALRPTGVYAVHGKKVTVRIALRLDGREKAPLATIEGTTANLAELADKLAVAIVAAASKP